jgi:hypothetical protein
MTCRCLNPKLCLKPYRKRRIFASVVLCAATSIASRSADHQAVHCQNWILDKSHYWFVCFLVEATMEPKCMKLRLGAGSLVFGADLLRNSGHPFVEGVYVRIFDSNLSNEG